MVAKENKKTKVPESSNIKKNNQTKSLKHNKIISETKTIYLIPLIFIICVLPLIVKIHEYSANLSQYPWFSANDHYFDFFLYYKQAFLIGTAVIMIAFILSDLYKNHSALKRSKIFIPLLIYAFLALMSSLFSKYRTYSFSGIFEQFESVLALLAYCLVAYYAFVFISSERDLKYLIYALLIGAILLSILGITQIKGHDFLNTQIGWSLISNSTYINHKEDFNFVAGLGRIYLSLYNPNYVGVYVSMVFPIMFFMIFFSKKIWIKILFLLVSSGLIVSLYGSKSTAGFIGVFAAVVLSCILFHRYIRRYYFITVPIFILLIISIFAINANTHYISTQLDKVLNIQKSSPALNEIQTNDNELVIKYNNNSIITNFSIDEYGLCNFQFKDQNNNFIQPSITAPNGPVQIIDERFPGFIFTPVKNGDVIGFDVLIDGQTWFFTNQFEDHTFYYFNSYGKYDKIIKAPSAVFTGYEPYASGRGYIWSRTIPLLKDKIILGSGADTFSLVFPQNDYVNKFIYGFGTQLMSKPHSLFLQMAVQTGVLSLISFLIFYGIYFFSSIKLYMTTKYNNIYSIAGSCIFSGTVGYMICSITNDSSVTVAPIFWVFIGTGIAINNKIRQAL